MKQSKISRIYRVVVLTAFCVVCLPVLVLPLLSQPAAAGQPQRRQRGGGLKVIQLPAPTLSGSVSLEEAISKRRSVRQFADKPLNYVQMGQLCWAGQGITDKERGYRAAPSAWAVYPIDLYFVTPEGLFVYRPEDHSMEQVQTGDLRQQLSKAAGQGTLAEAGCDIVIAGSVRKLAPKSGNKSAKFLMLEAGHVAENIQLQAVTLGLVSVPVGDFETKSIARVCGLPGDLEPLLIVCVGHPLASKGQSQSSGTTAVAAQRAVLVVPGANFADVELFETRRILSEAGLETVIAGPKIGPLQGAQGGLAASEVMLDGVRVGDFDAVVFIGGPGAVAYFNNPAALGIAREAAVGRKVIAAIDNAPTILAAAGLLNGVRATGFLTQRELMRSGGANYTGAPVERDGSIITASSPAAVVPFARAIVGALQERQVRSGKVP